MEIGAIVVGEGPQLGGTEVEAVLQQLLHETVNELTESFNWLKTDLILSCTTIYTQLMIMT